MGTTLLKRSFDQKVLFYLKQLFDIEQLKTIDINNFIL